VIALVALARQSTLGIARGMRRAYDTIAELRALDGERLEKNVETAHGSTDSLARQK
jgi:hypothetical protein